MFTQPFIQLIVAQIVITIAALIIAVRVLRVPFTTVLWAAALCNAVPLTGPLFKTPLFIQDGLVFVLLAPALFAVRKKHRIIPVLLVAVLLWPLITMIAMRAIDPIGNEWIRFLFRRFGFVVFFLAAFSGAFRGMRAREFLDSCLLIWIGMAITGLLQFFGLVNTDIYSTFAEMFRGLPFWVTAAAQTGFMGLNRGAVGVWGAVFVGYSLSMLFMSPKLITRQWTLYAVAALLSFIVILFSGSRTGLVAAFGVTLFIVMRLLASPLRRRIWQLAAVGVVLIGAFAFIQLYAPVVDFSKIAGRVSGDTSGSDGAGSRVEIQLATINYVLNDLRAFTVGMGENEEQFIAYVGKYANGLPHPHSEYLEILWQSGVPGLLLYLAFLVLLFRRMGSRYGTPSYEIGIAGQAMLAAGMLTGLAVGNIMITSARLAAFGLLMAFTYGMIVREVAVDKPKDVSQIKSTPVSAQTGAII